VASADELLLLINNNSDYPTIINFLRQYNQDIYDANSVSLRDQNYESNSSHIRDVLYSAKRPIISKKSEYLGIVLRVEKIVSLRSTYKIFVHVPKNDMDQIPEVDSFNLLISTNKIKLSDYEHLAFYPVSDLAVGLSPPAPKNIVRVELADNFFTAQFTNPLDNRFLGIFCDASRAAVPPTAAGPQIPSATGGVAVTDPPDRTGGVNAPATGKSFNTIGILKRFLRVSPDVVVYAFNKLKSLLPELTDSQIAGILGNFTIESGMDPKIVNSIGAIGIAQWLGARKAAVFQTAIDKKTFWYSLDHQLEFVAYESRLAVKPPKNNFGELSAFNNLKTKTTAEEAAISWMQKWERPSPAEQAESGPKRVAAAKEILDLVTKPATTSAPTAGSTAPVAAPASASQTKTGSTGSNPISYPKMKLILFDADLASGVRRDSKLGAKKIKIREDIKPDLDEIKRILNRHQSSLTINSVDISLNNKNNSLLSKVGLEIQLNSFAALSPLMNPEIDDYLVGPDYNFPVPGGYKLIVYANIKKNFAYINEKYQPETKLTDIYNIRNTYLKNKPNINKICRPLLNLTQIFEDLGFTQKIPEKEFFANSNPLASNWNIFQKTSKITKGYTYKELLKTVYHVDSNPIWLEEELFWNGVDFV
jgi:hypothetical protein